MSSSSPWLHDLDLGLPLLQAFLLQDACMGWKVFAALTLLCIITALYLLIHRKRKSYTLPPGSMGWPIIGETIQFCKQSKTGKFFDDRFAKHGPIFKTHVLGSPTVCVYGAERVKKILLGEHVLVSSVWPPSFKQCLGAGTLSQMDADNHKVYRKVFHRAFRNDYLNSWIPTLRHVIREEIATWERDEPINVYDALKTITFKSACVVFLGMDPHDDSLNDLNKDFEILTGGLFTLPIHLPGTAFHTALSARKRIADVLSAHFSSGSGLGSRGLLHHIHEACREQDLDLSTDSLIAMSLELLLGGQETSASSITSAILLLGRHPDILERLRAELSAHRLMEEEEQEHEELSVGRIESLTLLHHIMKEVLRIHPPIGGGFRKVLKTFTIDGYTIPAGWNINYNIKLTHESSILFQPSPDAFDPDRWDVIKDDRVIHCNYVPFGAGARACIGKQYGRLFFRLFLLELSRKYEWRLENENPEWVKSPILQPVGGLPVTFRSRRECQL